MSNKAWGHPVEDYSAVTFQNRGRICVVETGYLYPGPTSTFDPHFAVSSPSHYLIAQDPGTVEVIDPTGQRDIRHSATTNVPHYRTFVRDVLQRVGTDAAPVASLADMVPIMRLMDQAYAKAGPLPR